MKTVRVTDEVHGKLLKLKGIMISELGRNVEMNEVIEHLLGGEFRYELLSKLREAEKK